MVWMSRKEGQKVKFLGGEGTFLTVDPYPSRRRIDLQTSDLYDLIFLHAATDQTLISRQMGLHTGHQFAGAERLRHIIIGSQPKPPDLINVILLRRNHDDGSILAVADLPADLKSIHAGQHQIQDDQVKIRFHGLLQSDLAVVGNLHLKVAQLQIIPFQIRNTFLILNNQNPFTHPLVPPDIFLLQST